ncbi:MAG: putative Mg2+ transporter-C (MgtC) family protein [Chloroflexota bacterium]|jgi:putative Mg2+ transporter-C (MgtC) family protein|nr:putative Mg2+ transporter-C (MgtC) family protein [Chloroflexota bacterium]
MDFSWLWQNAEFNALIRIGLSGLVAGLIGLEREMAGKAAGMRTYGLVGIGAAMFTVTAIYGFGSLDYASRIVGGVITGIGFLGAGAILHTKVHIVGLTTAAGLWVAAGVGLAIGSGLYLIGIGAGVLLFILLQFAAPEEFIRTRRKRKGLDSIDAEDDFMNELAEAEDEDEERLKRTPRPLSAPLPQPPMNAWPGSIPAPPAHGLWSTGTKQGPPPTNGRG